MVNYQWVAVSLIKRKMCKKCNLLVKQAFDMFALDVHSKGKVLQIVSETQKKMMSL